MRIALPFAFAAIACGSPEDKGTDSGELTASFGEFGTHEDTGHPDAPVLEWATLVKRESTCFIEGGYSDPQGPADVRRGTIIAVDPDSGETVWTDDLFVCVDYACIGSFGDHAAYGGAPCTASARFEYRGFVYDRSDYQSNTVVLEQ